MKEVTSNADSISDDLLNKALGGVSSLKSRVSLSFEGINLPNLDVGSKTDAFAVLFQTTNGRK